ncbi:hypothetical protein [Gemmobacter sp. 24YEA27]|uniref:hypothetical protein n=1 Tax=Gemmobacter sp. 24YEA27 TaxID=3040672 RepID=UPI0024B3985F|nr:hypothetical protein [Gemmobacter sp. 24YEA27]
MTIVIARIIARYLAGALVAYGLLEHPDARAVEPDLAILIGAGIGMLTEGAYALARRFGWAT